MTKRVTVPYLIPNMKLHQPRPISSIRLDPEWKKAMQWFAKEEAARVNEPRLTMTAIFMADSLNRHPELRAKYNQLKKEKQYGTSNRTTGKQSH